MIKDLETKLRECKIRNIDSKKVDEKLEILLQKFHQNPQDVQLRNLNEE